MTRSIAALVLSAGCASTPPPAIVAHEPAPPLIEVPPSEAWRKEVPPPGPIDPRRKPPVFTTERLPNGLTLMWLRVEGMPIVSLRLVTKGGSATDPLEAAGLTFLTYGALRDGAGKLTSIGFERALQAIGAEMTIDVDRDFGSIEMAGLSSALPGMIRLLADALTKPRLEAKSLERRKKRHLERLSARGGGPLSVAGDRLPPLIHGDHPYGHAPHGTIGSIARIEIGQIQKHYAALFRPETSALIATGDFDPAQLTSMIAQHFGAWKPKGAAMPLEIPATRARPRSDVVLIHRDNVSQAFVCVGRAVSGANASDEVALAVINQILGGSFNSRLQLLLRETKGWTYGANSALYAFRGAGEILACTQVERSAAAEAVRALVDEFGRLGSHPPTDEEIRSAVLGLHSSIYRRDTVSQLSLLAAEIFARERPLDGLARFEQDLSALAPDAVRRAAEGLSPRELQIVVVANARGLRDELEQLGLGTVALSQ